MSNEELLERIRSLEQQLAATMKEHQSCTDGLREYVRLYDAERKAHEQTSRQGNATADGLYAELDKERKAREAVERETIARCVKVCDKYASGMRTQYERELIVECAARISALAPAAEAAESKLAKCIEICQEEGDEWASDAQVTEKNYAWACRDRILAFALTKEKP